MLVINRFSRGEVRRSKAPRRERVEAIDQIERVRQVRERLIITGSVDDPDGRSMRLFPVAIGPNEGRALLDVVREERARLTLEVGLGFGIATLFICEALLHNGPGGRHLAMDPYQLRPRSDRGIDYAGVGLRSLESAGVRDLVEFYEERSEIVLPRLLGERRRFDLALIDGDHHFEAVIVDLIYIARLVEDRKRVFVDDTQLPAVRRALAFCEANLGWTVDGGGTEGEHEWLVMRTGPAEAFDRPFTEFIAF